MNFDAECITCLATNSFHCSLGLVRVRICQVARLKFEVHSDLILFSEPGVLTSSLLLRTA